MRAVPLALMALAASPAAGDFRLSLPVDCVPGETCHIQNYVDHLPAGAAQDFRCGGLVYDGHKGTDFALPTMAEMERGVDVLAAASGVVKGVRDGMTDQRYDPTDPASVAGRECGNGVVIEHENGWETQYCHMRQGSVTVASGQQVEAGTVLGQIGLSGQTEFPHLHLSVRKDGQTVDPFVPGGEQDCSPAAQTLWQDSPEYIPGALLSVGFADTIPDYDSVRAGQAARTTMPGDAGTLVLFAHAFGSQAGDIIRLQATGPQGQVFAQDMVLEKAQAQVYRATGRRLTQSGWPAGEYLGTVSMIRDGTVISQKTITLTIP